MRVANGSHVRRHPDGVRELRTGQTSPVIWVSGAVLAAALLGLAWLAREELAPARPASEARRAAAGEVARAPEPASAAGARATSSRRVPRPDGAPAAPAVDSLAARTSPVAGPPPPGAPPSPSSPLAATSGSLDMTDPTDDAPADAQGPTGLAAFPPMGSKPILRGLVVPEGFELPPGYVRHYQATDDGRLLPPILRFHPDHPARDAAGRPLPPGSVVPPELAPPGMPLEPLEPPEPQR